MKNRNWTVVVLACLATLAVAHATPEQRRFLEGAAAAARLTPEQRAEDPKPYLPAGTVAAAIVIGLPPAVDSPEDKKDVEASRAANTHANATRWQTALDDDASVYNRFDEAFGIVLDRAHLPRAIGVLNRVEAEVLSAAGEAKKHYGRARPFQRFATTRVCGEAKPPKPEPTAKGTSYPSGHAVAGWALVLVLEEVAPERAQKLLARGVEYAQSRVVCGVHFPSDVEASRILAAFVVDRLIALPEFRRDMACAKTEYHAVLAGQKSEDLPACQ